MHHHEHKEHDCIRIHGGGSVPGGARHEVVDHLHRHRASEMALEALRQLANLRRHEERRLLSVMRSIADGLERTPPGISRDHKD